MKSKEITKNLLNFYLNSLKSGSPLSNVLTKNGIDYKSLQSNCEKYERKLPRISFNKEAEICREISKEILKHTRLLGLDREISEKFFERISKLHERLEAELLKAQRDHIIHPFHVFLLGYFLIQQNPDIWNKALRSRIEILIKEKWKFNEKVQQDITDTYFKNIDLGIQLYALWVIVASFHDVGYVVTGLKNIFKNTPFSISLCENTVDDLKKVASFYDSIFSGILGINVNLSSEAFNDAYKNEDHGFMSALFIEHILTSSGVMQTPWENAFPEKRIPILLLYEAMLAILFHNKPYLQFLSPLLLLLTIADNVQEWARYLPEKSNKPIKDQLKDIKIYASNKEINISLNFKKSDYSNEFFNRSLKNFDFEQALKISNELKNVDFQQCWNKFGMTVPDIKITCEPIGSFVLVHGKCGRATVSDRSEISPPTHCKYCSNS